MALDSLNIVAIIHMGRDNMETSVGEAMMRDFLEVSMQIGLIIVESLMWWAQSGSLLPTTLGIIRVVHREIFRSSQSSLAAKEVCLR